MWERKSESSSETQGQGKVETAGKNRQRKVGEKARSPWGLSPTAPVKNSSVNGAFWLGRKKSFVLFWPIGEQRVHKTFCVF